MMFLTIWARGLLFCISLSTLISAAHAQDAMRKFEDEVYQGELLVMTYPQDWYLAFHDRQGNIEIRQFLPNGQRIESWSEMISQQTLFHVTGMDPSHYLEEMMEVGKATCPDQDFHNVFAGQEKGYSVAVYWRFCPFAIETQMGEITLFKAIQGKDSLYIVHRAIRIPPFQLTNVPFSREQNIEWTIYMRENVMLCDTRLLSSCPDGLVQ